MLEWSLILFASFSALVGSCVALAVARLNVVMLPESDIDVDSYLEIDGLSLVASRAVYEAHYLELKLTMDEDEAVDIEICEGADDFVFSRISYRFAPTLNRGVRLMTEHADRVSNRVLQIREVNIGDAAFDENFLVFCHDEERVKRLFKEPVRTQILELGGEVKDLRITDDGVAVSSRKILKPDALHRLAQEVFKTAKSYADAARSLDDTEGSRDADSSAEMRRESVASQEDEKKRRRPDSNR